MKRVKGLMQMLSDAEVSIQKAERLGKQADAEPFMAKVADNAYYYKRKLKESFAQRKSFKKLRSWSHTSNIT